LVSQTTPYHVGPPSRIDGKRPTRIEQASTILLGISRASLIHTPVSSNDNNFLTSSGLSSAKNITSQSISPFLSLCVYGTLHVKFPQSSSGNQSSHVLIVVVFNCGFVLRITAQRVRRIPCSFGF